MQFPPTARDLADRYGLHRAGRQWRGTCPSCGYPDAFVLTQGRAGPLAWCVSCQDRAAMAALLRAEGAWQAPERHNAPDEAAARARRQERALALWSGAVPASGTPTDCYLTGRALPGLAASAPLRFRADTPHPEGGRLPAMLALVVDAAGTPIAVHRTFIRRDGTGKADVVPARASLGPVWGGAIRLDPLAPELVIGEGIETAASAGRMIGLPAWAAISAGNLGRGLVLPPRCDR